MSSRAVRFSRAFFKDLDNQLPEERSGDGTPSATDFLFLELPPIRDSLAEDLEGCTTVLSPGGRVRVAVASGVLVRGFALFLVVNEDTDIEVIGITIELSEG